LGDELFLYQLLKILSSIGATPCNSRKFRPFSVKSIKKTTIIKSIDGKLRRLILLVIH